MLRVDRSPLATRFATALQQNIEQKTWGEWLPGIRELSRRFGVSRVTCSQALHLLEQTGWVKKYPNIGTRVVARAARTADSKLAPAAEIGIIIPHPPRQLRTHVTIWLDELREHLSNNGQTLAICHSPRFYRKAPDRALAEYIQRHPKSCWLLLMTTREVQEWFFRTRVPAIIIGTPYEGVELTSVSSDLPAIGRHVARTLIAAGHRSIGLLLHRFPGNMPKRISAGDGLFAAAFPAQAKQRGHSVKARVFEHEDSLAGVESALQSALAGAQPCTALVVTNSHCYLAATCLLGERGLGVPRDLSLVCRDDDPFFEFIRPRPACYRGTWESMLGAVLVQLRNILNRKPKETHHIRLFPRFIKGASLAVIRPPLNPLLR